MPDNQFIYERPADSCETLEVAAAAAQNFDESKPDDVALYRELSRCAIGCPGELIEEPGRIGRLLNERTRRTCSFKLSSDKARSIVDLRLSVNSSDTLQTP